MDELPLGENEVARVVAEANVAFALNMRVFEELDVRGGVPGACVRNIRDALTYYDREIEAQERDTTSVHFVGVEEKCPFGYGSGAAADDSEQTVVQPQKQGRCPWPFVFFHDPATGMKDWQSWLVMGLVFSWLW